MSRVALAELLDRLVPKYFPIEGTGQTLVLARHGLALPAPSASDALGAALCLRRGATYAAEYSLTQQIEIAGVAHLETTPAITVPLTTPEGWMLVGGQAYDADALFAEIAERIPRWLATCAASARLQMPTSAPENAWAAFLQPRDELRIFAPRITLPIVARRAQPAVAECDGRTISLDVGGVLVWPEDGDMAQARVYLAFDDEEVRAPGRVRRGDALFETVPRVSRVLDARDPIEVAVQPGDTIAADDLLACGDGRSLRAGRAGTVKRVEIHEQRDTVVDAVAAAARPVMKEDFARRMARELTGRIATFRIMDDRGRVLFQKGDTIRFGETPTFADVDTVIAYSDDDALDRVRRDFDDSCHDLPPALRPPAWLRTGLAPGVRHRVRILVEPRQAP